MNPLFLYQSTMTVSGTRWHLLSSGVLLINDRLIMVFCRHNFAGTNGPEGSFTESLVAFTGRGVYKSAGDNYWSAMLFTDLRVSITGPQKKHKSAPNRPKKGP